MTAARTATAARRRPSFHVTTVYRLRSATRHLRWLIKRWDLVSRLMPDPEVYGRTRRVRIPAAELPENDPHRLRQLAAHTASAAEALNALSLEASRRATDLEGHEPRWYEADPDDPATRHAEAYDAALLAARAALVGEFTDGEPPMYWAWQAALLNKATHAAFRVGFNTGTRHPGKG
jgi:hypothetical protein